MRLKLTTPFSPPGRRFGCLPVLDARSCALEYRRPHAFRAPLAGHSRRGQVSQPCSLDALGLSGSAVPALTHLPAPDGSGGAGRCPPHRTADAWGRLSLRRRSSSCRRFLCGSPRQRRDLVGQVRSAGLRLDAWPHCAASLPSGPQLRHIACNVAARLRLANSRPTLTACSRQRRARWLTATCGVAATPGGNAATVFPVSSRSRRADFKPAPIAFRPCGHFVLIGTRSLRAAALTALASL